MSIDEYAQLESATGANLVKVDDVWWRQVKPFFYQPLFPFFEIRPGSKKTPPGAIIGGFQHLVPEAETANSQKKFFIWDEENVRNYSLDKLGHQRRSNIRKGIRHLTVRKIDEKQEFVAAGHSVYCSFYERSGYFYKKERLDRRYFAKWADSLYRFPKVRIVGAYYKNDLSAVDISYLVDNVLIAATFFSKTEALKYQINDLMVHEMRQQAARCPEIAFIYKGVVTGRKGIDESKLQRGCKLLSKPAFFGLNPAAALLLKAFSKNNYKKITGEM